MEVILSIGVLVGVGAVVWRLFNAAFRAPVDAGTKSDTKDLSQVEDNTTRLDPSDKPGQPDPMAGQGPL